MSKRKLGLAILTALLCVCMAMFFVACGTQGEQGEKGEQGEAGADGISIVSVEKVDSEGLTDTYKITYSDGNSTTFTVTNGKDGADGQTPFIGENGNWWIGSVDTGIPAKGQDGSDGEDGTDGEDGQTPFIGENGNWWIGSVDTGVPAKGENGTDGKDGISITDVDINDAGELILYFSEGEPVNLGKIVGENGQDGADGNDGIDGVGIEGATIDENGDLILSLSNDTDINVGKVKGEDGQDGTDGKDGIGITGVKIENGELIITFSDGNSSNLGNIVGADGKDGTDGKDGVGIDRIELDENYNLTIYLTEGEPIKLGCIRGEKGENGADGKSAYELYKEKFGYEDTEEQWLIDLANGNLAVVETHTVTFDAQGGSPEPETQEVKHLGKASKPENPVRDGFLFDGWYYQGEKWSFVGYVVTEDMTLTAQWSEADSGCEITSAEGFEFGTEIIDENEVQTITRKVANATPNFNLAAAIRVSEGCTWKLFTDYVQSEEITSKIMTDLQTGDNIAWLVVYGESDQTLYKVNVYRRHIRNYTFQSNGETHTSGTIEEDHKLNIPETNPTNKAGYTFSHWTVDGEQVVFPYTVTVDTTFIAVFTPNSNTLHFDGNGATGGGMDDMTIATDASANLTANGYVRAGYTFKGWATSEGGAVEYTDGATYTMGTESEYTLYAVWEANNNTLHFDGNGATGGAMEDMTIATDASANLTANGYVRAGYTFKGWATSADGAVEYTDGAIYTMGTESEYTLYAVWEIITYSITYDLDGGKWEQGENPNTFTIDDLPVKLNLTVPTKTEYAFFGWFDSAEFENEVPTEISNLGDVEIYALFITGTKGLQYREENGGYTVSGYTGSVNDVIIPDLHLDKPVLSIGDRAFYGCISLTSVIFGGNSQLTSIGDSTFYDCSGLTSIDIPSGVTHIGDSAFYDCSSLTSIDIPSGVTSIGNDAFIGCSSLTSVIFGENSQLTSIGSDAFYACSSLTSIEIPSGVTSIDGFAFMYCSSLESIEIPSGVTSIDGFAFSGCSSLTSIEIPSGVTSIGRNAFHGCTGLTSVIFGENSQLTSIGYYAFEGCSSLTSIEIPSGVTSIGERAFSDCNSLTSIEIPSGVTSIGVYAFSGCSNIDTINVASNNSVYKSDGNCLIGISTNTLIVGCKNSIIPNYVTSISYFAFSGCTSLTSIDIPSSVTSIGNSAFIGCTGLTSVIFGDNSQLTSIGNYAFDDCSGLTSIEIPSSVTSIGNSAFSGCSSLTSVTFGDNSQLTSIGDYAFYGCSGLTSVIFGENSQLTSIGYSAFNGCSSLTSIEIPSSVTSIGSYAFDGCIGLTGVYISDIEAWCNIHFYGSSNPLYYAHNLYLNGELVTDLIIPDSVTSIGDRAFLNCSSLTSIEIPSGVTSIGSSAFSGCSSLTSIEIPSGVTSIGSGAFYDCSGLTSVIFGENSKLTSIGRSAFEGCSRLTSIEIPNSVASIGSSAFSGCSSLKTVFYGGASEEDWAAISIGSYNTNLTTAARYYYSEEKPITTGNYWHYVNGKIMKWEWGDSKTFHFETNGGEPIEDITFPALTELPIPIKEGYYFLGWYDNAEFNGNPVEEPYVPSGDITLYAKWEKEKTVTFVTNCDQTVENMITVDLQIIELPVLTREGYYLIGWYDNAEFNGSSIEEPYVPSGDITLYAKWEKEKTVTFVTNCDQTVENMITVGLQITELPVLTREGYYLIGWYDNAEFNGSPVKKPYAPSGDITLYAKWEKEKTVTFVTNCDQTVENMITVGLQITELPVLSREGYYLIGWYDNAEFNGNPVEEPYVPSGDVTLYAKWVEMEGYQSAGLEIENGVIVGIGSCTDEVLYLNMPIAERAFVGCDTITKVILGEGVTSIGAQAFGESLTGCQNLKEVVFESAVPPEIGSDVFGTTWNASDFRVYVPAEGLEAYEAVDAEYWQQNLVGNGKLQGV